MSLYDIDETCGEYGCRQPAYAVRVTSGEPMRFLCYDHDRKETNDQGMGQVRQVSSHAVPTPSADGPVGEPDSGRVHGKSGPARPEAAPSEEIRGRKPALIIALVGLLVLGVCFAVKYVAAGNATAGGKVTGDACAQNTYSLYSKTQGHWTRRFDWAYNPKGARPGSLEQIRSAVNNVIHNRNDCGDRREFKAYASFTGKTTRAAQVDAYGRCKGFDGQNTVSFGPIYSGALAVTCVSWTPAGMYEADVRIATNRNVYPAITDRCTDGFDLQGIATHEMGRVFGLNTSSGTAQTMYAYAPKCSTAWRTLGAGDIAGMRSLYGYR